MKKSIQNCLKVYLIIFSITIVNLPFLHFSCQNVFTTKSYSLENHPYYLQWDFLLNKVLVALGLEIISFDSYFDENVLRHF